MIDLKFNQVSKKYNIRANSDSPKRWYGRGFPGRKKPVQMWALRNVSFQVNEGEALGIVGVVELLTIGACELIKAATEGGLVAVEIAVLFDEIDGNIAAGKLRLPNAAFDELISHGDAQRRSSGKHRSSP